MTSGPDISWHLTNHWIKRLYCLWFRVSASPIDYRLAKKPLLSNITNLMEEKMNNRNSEHQNLQVLTFYSGKCKIWAESRQIIELLVKFFSLIMVSIPMKKSPSSFEPGIVLLYFQSMLNCEGNELNYTYNA